MATKSKFDCDSIDTPETSNREQIVYDEDIFSFGTELPSDKFDAASKNVSISVSYSPSDRRKNGKRKALELNDGPLFKARELNIPTIEVTSNGVTRQAVTNNEKRAEYEILKKIGNGTYGNVYKARLNNKDVIAIKRITCKLNRPHTAQSLIFIRRECDNLRLVQGCKNIVLFLKEHEKTFKNDFKIDLLLEYCPHDLKKILSNLRITLKLEEIKSFLRQILLGLKYMHRKSIMHRDLKSENILMTVDGVVKIADLGMSRKFSDPFIAVEKERFSPNVVTQWYRAPEILLGDTYYNESVDIWSFGCVMGEFWNRQAILPGNNEIHQITIITRLCGSMTPENWPNIVNLKMYQTISKMPTSKRLTRIYLKNKAPFVLDDQANDLFDKLLRYNPQKRLSTSNALNDNFFYSYPLPVKNLKTFMSRILPTLCSYTNITK